MVTIFTRSITDDLAGLVREIDATVSKNSDRKMRAFVVLLTDNPDADEKRLAEFAAKHGIKDTPLTIFDGIAGPPNYKIARDADVTVLHWVGKEVKSNQAFAKGKLDKAGVETVLKGTATILK